LTVFDTLEPDDEDDDASLPVLGEDEADGVGLALGVDLVPPVKISPSVLPMLSSRPPPPLLLLADAEGVGVAVSAPDDLLADADGLGVAFSPEPESDEPDEVLPESD
jgi:hypothetical protein